MHYLAVKELQLEEEVQQKIVTRTQVVPDDNPYLFLFGKIACG